MPSMECCWYPCLTHPHFILSLILPTYQELFPTFTSCCEFFILHILLHVLMICRNSIKDYQLHPLLPINVFSHFNLSALTCFSLSNHLQKDNQYIWKPLLQCDWSELVIFYIIAGVMDHDEPTQIYRSSVETSFLSL